jgi:hypothetical protein
MKEKKNGHLKVGDITKTPSNKNSIAKNDSPFSTPLINELSEKEAKIKLKEAYKELYECSENLKLAAEIGNQLLNEKIKIENLYKNSLEKIKELKEISLNKENSNLSNEREEHTNSEYNKYNASQDDLKNIIKELEKSNSKNYQKIEQLKEEIQVYQIQIENNKIYYEEEINKYKNEWKLITQKYKQIYNMRIEEITEITKELNLTSKRDELIQKFKERSLNDINSETLNSISKNQLVIDEDNSRLVQEYQRQINNLKSKNTKLQSELKAAHLIKQSNNEKIESLESKLKKYKDIVAQLQLKNDKYSNEMKSVIHNFEPNLRFDSIKKENDIYPENVKLDKDNVEINTNIYADTTLDIFKDLKNKVIQEIIQQRNKIREEKAIQTDKMELISEKPKSESISVETQTVVTLPEKIITPFSALYKKNKESNTNLSKFINIIREKNELLPLNYYNKNRDLINIPLYHDDDDKDYKLNSNRFLNPRSKSMSSFDIPQLNSPLNYKSNIINIQNEFKLNTPKKVN